MKVQDIINDLSQYDPESEVVFTCGMEQGRGYNSSNHQSTDFDIDTIDTQEELDEVYYTNPDCSDGEEDDTPTFTKQIVHLSMSGEESDYQ